MDSYRNFVLLILVEFAIVAALFLFRRTPVRRAVSILWRSALLGLPLGLCYDLLIGKYNTVFGYYPAAETWSFYILNAVLSYGLAIGTAWMIPERLHRAERRLPYAISAPVIAIGLVLLFALPVHGLPTLVVMFVGGALVLLISEAAAALASFEGVILSTFQGKPMQGFRLWAISISLGAVYELANSQFPVWRWQRVPGLSHTLQELLIVALGYVVLFYPLFIATRILDARPK